MKFAVICITIALLAACTTSYGQGYYFRHYQVEQGLSNNTVFCSVQDSKGFMWFGTKDGVNRFDGITFKVFRPDPNDPKSLGNNFVYSLHEDARGILWVGTREGLYRYDAPSESFSYIEHTRFSDVRDLTSDKKGNVWFVVGLKLFRYNEQKDSVPELINKDSSLITSVVVTANDQLWASTIDGKLHSFNAEYRPETSYDVFDQSAPTQSRWIEDLFDTGKGFIFIATSNQGIKSFDITGRTYKDILTFNADRTDVYGRDFVHYGGDEYWIATESGIYVYNLKDGTYSNLRKRFNDPYSISDNAVYSLCRDKEGGIWAGTYFGGVNYYPRQYTSFQKYYPDNTPNTISGNAVREICEDQYGQLWIGTEDRGLNKLNRTTGKITHYLPDGTPSGISYSNIHGILPTGNELWIGTFEHGLDVMDIRTGKVIRHYSGGGGASSFRGNFILTLYQTRSGELLAGTPLGLFRYVKDGDHFTAVDEAPGNHFIYCILEDHQGTIWLGTIGSGVLYYNPATGDRGRLLHDPASKNSLPSDLVNNVFEDSRRQLWFATEGGGLCKYDHAKRTIKQYTTRDGLPSDFVFKILEDGKQQLWVSTSRGLTCFDPVSGKMKVYTKANGLLSDQFNYNAGFKDKSGRMYFGSVKGMISFNPDEFTSNNYVPPVYITGFQVNNKELPIDPKGDLLRQSIIQTAGITLTHDASTFSIDFAALSYTAPEMTQYAYKMEGLDRDWTYLTSNRKVYFTGLSAGTYHFLVKAANSSGAWSSQVTRINIRVLPPWWASQWAYVAYSLIAFLLILYIVRNYHHRTEEKNKRKLELMEHEKEKELYQSKIEFFTNVAHEIRTPLTLIKGPLEKVIKKAGETPDLKNSLQIMDRNTNRLVDLTNQLLDFRQTETRGFSLSFTPVDITGLLEETYANFKPLAEQRNLHFSLDMPEGNLLNMADADALNKIFSNLFSNAVKYAGKQVHVRLLPLEPGQDYFFIEVTNDGDLIPGDMSEKIFEPFFRLKRTEKTKGTGIGLALARSLAQLHKGDLYLQPSTNGLNTFVLKLPLLPPDDNSGSQSSNDLINQSVNE
ncbi:sensor histidine kinase [Paraflavitalea sp. CAU 1676]|uniref:ligand-binding sensor domain-containing protein n=1 Tax=Paraflavitalea sp. CAU 1676 TaxID=3032598 RepID=UPI0023DA4C47|nr:sensor histidine kinase [Paraflavitalea sp. CAU 1676]MDF2191836.1 two-component regulator propeller domain-containing protein [Paraflavitalea sp. CAU 1676]